MNQIEEMRRQGLSVTAIAEVTGFDRKTVRKYLAHPDLEPRYKPRPGRPTLLDPLKAYIEERLAAGVWNAVVLARELKERGYKGGYSTVKEYLQPKREAARIAVVRRFETPPGRHYAESGVMLRALSPVAHPQRRAAFFATPNFP